MKELETLQNSVFVGHVHVTHTGSEWRGEHCIHCYIYPILENRSLTDSIAFVHEDSTALESEKDAVVVGRSLDQKDGGLHEDVVMGDGHYKGSDSKRSKLELFALFLDAKNVPEDDCSLN